MIQNPLKVGYFVKMYPRLSETFILNEILELERRGVQVTIFSLKKPDEGRFHAKASQVKANVFYLDSRHLKTGWPILSEHWPVLSPHGARLWGLFEELLAQENPRYIETFFAAVSASAKALELGLDHLHAHFASTPSTAAYYASRITGLGFSFTAHAKGIFRDSIDRDHLEEKIGAASFVSTVTQFNKSHILMNFPTVLEDKVRVVYNGIDLDLFNMGQNERREPGLILGIGRLVPKKGFSDLVTACSLLRDRGVPFRCVIIGDGEQRGHLESMIVSMGLCEDVVLAGPKTQCEVRDYLMRASAFVLPCTLDTDGNQDALPTVLLEAMAMGCPVVSTTISGVPEIVDSGIDGLLVRPGNPVELAQGIERILDDLDFASALSQSGRAKAEQKFDVTKNVQGLEELFREARLPGFERGWIKPETIGA